MQVAVAVAVAAVAEVDDEDGVQWWRRGGAFNGGGSVRWGRRGGLRIGNDEATMEIDMSGAGGNGGRQLLTVMDEGGCWRLMVVMDGSCGSGG